MKKLSFTLFGILSVIIILSIVCAQEDLSIPREIRIKYGHVIEVGNIKTVPEEVVPGDTATLSLDVSNMGTNDLRDIRIRGIMPSQLTFLNDISTRKVSLLPAGESRNLKFNLIALPTASGGVYTANLMVDYINAVADEIHENYTFAMIIGSDPEIFITADTTEIYKKTLPWSRPSGKVTVTFFNNDVSDIKFLTVELKESSDYDIIKASKDYIGDLDSDDYESVDFRIKLKTGKDQIVLPLLITYKDPLNNDYSEEIEAVLKIRTADELGISTNGTALWAFLIIVIAVIAFFVYRRYKNKKHNHYAKDGFLMPEEEVHKKEKKKGKRK